MRHRNFFCGALVGLLLFSCTAFPPPPSPPATNRTVTSPPGESPRWRIPLDFRVVGYFPSWSGDPSSVRYRALSHINYAFALVDAQGTFQEVAEPEKLAEVVRLAHEEGVKVILSVGGWNGGITRPLERMAADGGRIAHFVAGALAILDAFHLDGIDLDWEYPKASTAVAYARLVRSLVWGLRPRGYLVTLAVSANDLNGRAVLDDAFLDADWLNVMAYDDGWSGPPGTFHSTYAFARSSLDYWITKRGVPRAKVVLGVPFYGRHLDTWKARSYSSLLTEYPDAASFDAVGGFGYNGSDTLRAKVVNLARLRAGGVMIWQLNQDAAGPGSLLSLVFDTVKEPLDGVDDGPAVP